MTTELAIIRHKLGGRRIKETANLSSVPAQYEHLDLLRSAAILCAQAYREDVGTIGERTCSAQPLPGTDGWFEDKQVPPVTRLRGYLQTPNLTYRLWVNSGGAAPVVLLVFRGTKHISDFYSNLRWLTLFIPFVDDHYDQVERMTPAILRYVRSRYGTGALIASTGHSLGGGLAQTAAYAAGGEIETVLAFDPSPVTKHSVAKKMRARGSPKRFYRIFEQSEVLSWLRFLLRMCLGLREAKPHMVEIKVHLFRGIGIHAHSMDRLARGLDSALST